VAASTRVIAGLNQDASWAGSNTGERTGTAWLSASLGPESMIQVMDPTITSTGSQTSLDLKFLEATLAGYV
jgi:hypothetical protein